MSAAEDVFNLDRGRLNEDSPIPPGHPVSADPDDRPNSLFSRFAFAVVMVLVFGMTRRWVRPERA